VAFSENGEWRPVGEKQEACGETFSENSPFFTRGAEGGTSPFSNLREWEERGVTTPTFWRRGGARVESCVEQKKRDPTLNARSRCNFDDD